MSWRKAFSIRHLSDHQGFSVIELAVVVTIVVALAALSAPIMSGLSPSYNSKKAARQIVSQMQLARIHAIKTGSTPWWYFIRTTSSLQTRQTLF